MMKPDALIMTLAGEMVARSAKHVLRKKCCATVVPQENVVV